MYMYVVLFSELGPVWLHVDREYKILCSIAKRKLFCLPGPDVPMIACVCVDAE